MFAITYPAYIRDEARRLRLDDRLSLDEIAARLALGRTTIWHWIKDLPDPEIKHRDSGGRRRGRERGTRVNSERAAGRRRRAYRQGWDEFALLDAEPTFRDFVCMYIGEGYKRDRNMVAIANSDPQVVRLGHHWISRFSTNRVSYQLQFHADQDPDRLITFWSGFLGVDRDRFSLQRKSNSGQLRGRRWRSRWGVLTVRVGDTQLRARLQGWIDRVQDRWIDSLLPGCSSAW